MKLHSHFIVVHIAILFQIVRLFTEERRQLIVRSKSHSVFMRLKKIQGILCLITFFLNHKYALTYTECFYASIQMTTFPPFIVNVANYINGFSKINVLCTPRINSTWLWYIFTVHCWNWLANISLRIFFLRPNEWDQFASFLFHWVLTDLGIKVILSHKIN